jgi:hypothetical protein
MSERTPESNVSSDYLYNLANALAQREDAIGGLAEDGPSSEEVRNLADYIKSRLISAEHAGGSTPYELWETMEAIAAVSDKWADPETDALGSARDIMEEQIYAVGRLLAPILPDSAENIRQWGDLRALNHAIARSLFCEKKNPPPRLTRLVNSVTFPLRTLLATTLYKIGGGLKRIGGRSSGNE